MEWGEDRIYSENTLYFRVNRMHKLGIVRPETKESD
jgi:hypothetical protein